MYKGQYADKDDNPSKKNTNGPIKWFIASNLNYKLNYTYKFTNHETNNITINYEANINPNPLGIFTGM